MRLFVPLLPFLLAGLQTGCTRSLAHGDAGSASPHALNLRYDSNRDAFSVWRAYFRDGPGTARIRYKTVEPSAPAILELTALGDSPLGLNMRVPDLHGRVVFDYRVTDAGSSVACFGLYVLPMRDSPEAPGPVEVGSTVPGDPRNERSQLRTRFLVPTDDFDGLWHHHALEFDFRELPDTAYSIIAPRINEGVDHPSKGTIQFRNLRIMSE